MTTAADRDPGLREVIEHAETEAIQLLDAADSAPLDVVVWLSAHLAALERSVYPIVRERLSDGAAVVARHRALADRMTRTLRVIERRHSGDVLAAGLDPERMIGNLRALVGEHRSAQTDLLERLAAELTLEERAALTSSYEHALAHGPTRPHPHVPRNGLMFRLEALRDRVLDTMDGRHVPVPRMPRRRLTPGRWGAYLLGQPHEQQRDAG